MHGYCCLAGSGCGCGCGESCCWREAGVAGPRAGDMESERATLTPPRVAVSDRAFPVALLAVPLQLLVVLLALLLVCTAPPVALALALALPTEEEHEEAVVATMLTCPSSSCCCAAGVGAPGSASVSPLPSRWLASAPPSRWLRLRL